MSSIVKEEHYGNPKYQDTQKGTGSETRKEDLVHVRRPLPEVSPKLSTASCGHRIRSLPAGLLGQGKASELETCHLLNHQASLGFP